MPAPLKDDAGRTKWIRTDERLPEDGATVWFTKGGKVYCGAYRNERFGIRHHYLVFGKGVTHWQPCPTPEPPEDCQRAGG